MRTGLAYTSARILLLVASMGLLYLAGARGLTLLVLAFVMSALISYVLLSKQRDVMSAAFSRRVTRTGRRASELRRRIEEGAAAEDVDDDADQVSGNRPAGASGSQGGTMSQADAAGHAGSASPAKP